MTKTQTTPHADALIARALAPHREALQMAAARAAMVSRESMDAILPALLDKIEAGEQMTPKARRECAASLKKSLSRDLVAGDMQERTRAAIKALSFSEFK